MISNSFMVDKNGFKKMRIKRQVVIKTEVKKKSKK